MLVIQHADCELQKTNRNFAERETWKNDRKKKNPQSMQLCFQEKEIIQKNLRKKKEKSSLNNP